MHKLITLSDLNYFDIGQLFLKTRDVIKGNPIVLYGPDLTKKQIDILKKHDIEYCLVNKQDWDTKMQFMKFQFSLNEIEKDSKKNFSGFMLNDLDIFFIMFWNSNRMCSIN